MYINIKQWCGDQHLGWGGIVLKNKLRNLKSRIKQWSIQNEDVNNNKILQLKQKLHEVDLIAQDRTLSEDEVKSMRSIQQDLWEASFAYESLLRLK